MKPSNGFNKKEKEEIREIVKSEIREAFRKNAKPETNVKDEVMEAIYSILNEKNDDLINNISEIEDMISQVKTEESLFAGFIRFILRIVCYIMWLAFGILVIYALYLYLRYRYAYFLNTYGPLLWFPFLFVGIIILNFHVSIGKMNKNDLYNSFMFIITMIAFIITVWTVAS